MSQQQRGVLRAENVQRVDHPAFVTDGAATPGGAMTVVPIVHDGLVAGIEVRCRCGESVLIECEYGATEPRAEGEA